jgi:hypothetical protein
LVKNCFVFSWLVGFCFSDAMYNSAKWAESTRKAQTYEMWETVNFEQNTFKQQKGSADKECGNKRLLSDIFWIFPENEF